MAVDAPVTNVALAGDRGRRLAIREPPLMASKVEALRQALRRLIAQHEADGMLPTSARFLFYELVSEGVISKQTTGARRPDQNVSEALTDLRRSGEIPWSAIADETRSLDNFTGWPTIADAVDAYLYAIRLDPLGGAAPLILTESRSLAGVLRDLAQRYPVKIASTNGQVAGFLHNDVAPALGGGARVLYLGDFDWAGGHIEANTRRVLEQYHETEWERLALTQAQVDAYSLPVIMKLDRRDGRARKAVETEALSQRLIVQIVRDRLAELLPEPLEAVHVREEAERERLRQWLAGAPQ
jgi:hypothetical protein